VEIAFHGEVAPYIRARVWHPSQQIRDDDAGGLVLTMDVCHDWALRSWILSWGRFARVIAPASLVTDVRTDLQAADAHYVTT
jgi:proteasome accessory factor B